VQFLAPRSQVVIATLRGQPEVPLVRHRYMRCGLMTVVLIVLALAGCTSTGSGRTVTSSPPPAAARSSTSAVVPALASNARPLAGGWCSARQLAVKYSGGASAMTGEHSALISVWNVSHTKCRVSTYPRVELFHGGTRLPFGYRHGGMYIQDKPGSRLLLAPGAAANFLVAKYRCDAGDTSSVTGLALKIPPLAIRIGFPAGYAGPTMAYCQAFRGSASRDPGNTVEIGPYVRGVAHGT
jgi:hypothetical protein